MPVLVHVLLVIGLERARAAQLLQRAAVASGPLRRGDRLVGDAPGREVIAAVADHVQERVVGLMGTALFGRGHHAEHVRFPQPAQQARALPQRRLPQPLLSQVGEHHIGPLRPALVVPRVGDRSGQQPAKLAGLAVRHPHHHVADHLTGAQGPPYRKLLRPEPGPVLVHRPPDGCQGPGGHLGLRQAEDPPRRRVRAQHGPVSSVIDDTRRHGLEQRPAPLLCRSQLSGHLRQLALVADVGADIGGKQQDPRDAASGVTNRLIDAIDEPLFGLPAAVDPHLRLAAANQFPGFHAPGQSLHLALRGQFRQGLAQWPACQIPAADQPEAGVVGEIDNQVRHGQVGHGRWQAPDKLPHTGKPGRWSVPAPDRNLCTPGSAIHVPLP